jgi:hypothetical protein
MSLLWAWKGSFKVEGELDRVMASFWAGLVKIGLQFGLGRVPSGAFWRVHKPNRKSKFWVASKRVRNPNSSFRANSDPALETPMMPMVDLPKASQSIGLVPGKSGVSMEDLPKVVQVPEKFGGVNDSSSKSVMAFSSVSQVSASSSYPSGLA